MIIREIVAKDFWKILLTSNHKAVRRNGSTSEGILFSLNMLTGFGI
jgi:hypothetical protein